MGGPKVHASAQVHPEAHIADDVEIGPFCIIGPKVKIGRGTRLHNNVVIAGTTELGEHNQVFPFCVFGTAPQDSGYKDEEVFVKVGHRNLFREYVTINCGTLKGDRTTTVGSSNMIMAYCHIAHDCVLEDGIIMANGVQLGGHTKVEKEANFGGLAAVHHFSTIGERSFVGGLTRVVHDVPPYMTVEGHPSRVKCVNTVGLKRKGLTKEAIEALKEAYKLIYRSGFTKAQAMEILEKRRPQYPEVQKLISFLRAVERGRQGRAREALRRAPVAPATAAGTPSAPQA
ncbi:MAG: acyl-ACP--UDP-N-acetylglucosamine O-acyltransferase [Planctomycetes bacterium]|nr:acyl-ACP--UDP-N-acetylglucosamine O-acyltransferase [Planctomycetota bacterium]